MVTPENYNLCFDKARKLSNFSSSEHAVDLGYKLYEVNHNDLDLIIFQETELKKLKRYDEALRFCDKGLKIDDKIKTFSSKLNCIYCKLNILVELNRIDEAMEFFSTLPVQYKSLDTAKLSVKLKKQGRFEDILELCNAKFNINPKGIHLIDSIKDTIDEGNLNVELVYPKELYMSWIYSIKGKHNHETCPVCGSKLDLVEDEFIEDVKKLEEINSLPKNPDPYGGFGSLYDIYLQCVDCKEIVYLGCLGLNIEFNDDILLKKYVQHKLCELAFCKHFLTSKGDIPLQNIKSEFYGLDDKEFNAFMTHLKNIDFIYEPREGYIKFVDEDTRKKIEDRLKSEGEKEYLEYKEFEKRWDEIEPSFKLSF